jgi:hypothetical protein
MALGLLLVVAVIAVLLISLVFSMFGLGGAVLYTPLLFLLGFAALASISTSLVINLLAVLSATAIYYRQGLVDIKIAAWFIPGVCVGALAGGAATEWIDPAILMWLFSAFLVVMGLRMMLTSREQREGGDACQLVVTPKLMVTIVGFSAAVGLLSGLIGIGGGIMIAPFLIFLCDQPVKGTAGTTAFIVIFSSLFGVIGHSAVGNLDPWLILPTAAAALVGSQIGARRMVRTGAGAIMLGFGAIMWVFAAILVLKLMGMM